MSACALEAFSPPFLNTGVGNNFLHTLKLNLERCEIHSCGDSAWRGEILFRKQGETELDHLPYLTVHKQLQEKTLHRCMDDIVLPNRTQQIVSNNYMIPEGG